MTQREPLQTADLQALSPVLTRQKGEEALTFVRAGGTRYSGARAVFETLRRLPGAWGVAGAILATPPLSWLAEPFYRLFARYRGRVSRALGLERCEI